MERRVPDQEHNNNVTRGRWPSYVPSWATDTDLATDSIQNVVVLAPEALTCREELPLMHIHNVMVERSQDALRTNRIRRPEKAASLLCRTVALRLLTEKAKNANESTAAWEATWHDCRPTGKSEYVKGRATRAPCTKVTQHLPQ